MPRYPKKPCRYPGCPNLTDQRFCEEHRKLLNREYEKYYRDVKTKQHYDANWKKIRAKYAAAHPYCEECFKKRAMVEMEHVHHIIPLREGGTHDEDNLVSLCKSCHSRIHARKGDRWGGESRG